MPICQHCAAEWSWKQTMKATMTLDTALVCPECDHKQYMTKQSRRKLGFLNFLIPLNLLLPVVFNVPFIVTISFLIGSGLIVILIHPFFIQLSNQEDPIW